MFCEELPVASPHEGFRGRGEVAAIYSNDSICRAALSNFATDATVSREG